MNKKIIIQLILFLIILLLVSLFFFKYSTKNQTKNSDTKKTNTSSISDKNFSNIIENIEYTSNDEVGNQYIIKAKYGEILNESKNLILMKNVRAEIIFNYGERITITSKKAIYNNLNYDTNFEEDIFIRYAEHNISSNNVDLLFKDNKVKIYNEIKYNNLNTNLSADIAEIDLLSKNVKIYMNENEKKINIKYNSYAN